MVRGKPDFQTQIANPTLAVAPISNYNTRVSGTWAYSVGPDHYTGARKYSSEAGAYMEFSFTGRMIGLVHGTRPTMGIASIAIDDESYDDIDMYDAQYILDVFTVIEGNLDPGEDHTLRVTCSGTKNPSSTGNEIDVEGFIVLVDKVPFVFSKVAIHAPEVWPASYDETDEDFHKWLSMRSTLAAASIPALGIVGATAGGSPVVVLVDSDGKLSAKIA